jgi:hypothetical protein
MSQRSSLEAGPRIRLVVVDLFPRHCLPLIYWRSKTRLSGKFSSSVSSSRPNRISTLLEQNLDFCLPCVVPYLSTLNRRPCPHLAANGSCIYRHSKPIQTPFWPIIDLLSNFPISLKIDSIDMACFNAMFFMTLIVLLVL